MNQHESRQIAMQAIFLANQSPALTATEVESKIREALDLATLPSYSKKLIEGVIAQRAELRQALAANLKKGWRWQRLNPIIVAILEIALYEIKESSAIEPKAAINEALNLCDEFSDPKGKAFINGVLANFVA